MSTNHTSQADLFDPDGYDGSPSAAGLSGVEPLPPLAIPCGYRNRSNAPCRRLGVRPVIIDGEPFHHRGARVVRCDPVCFRDDGGGSGGAEAPGGSEGGAVRVAG